MQKEKMLLNELITVWLNILSSSKAPAVQIVECTLIASDALIQLKRIRPEIVTLAGNNAANAFINEMSMVVVAINHYHTIRFKENYHIMPILSKTKKALEQLQAHLNSKTEI